MVRERGNLEVLADEVYAEERGAEELPVEPPGEIPLRRD